MPVIEIDATQLAEAELKRLAALHLPRAKLILFGSRATGRAGRRSDFDLAVVPKAGFDPAGLSAFRHAIEESSRIIYAVDAVNVEDVDEAWRARIEREGTVWKN